jgi:enoyl-CoA hydratase/carnithine racemase
MQEPVVFDVVNQVGIATLNRPQVHNALSHAMITALHAQLDIWRQDNTIRAVMLAGAGEKAFCAGGDIRALYDAYQAGEREGYRTFFVDEYRLDHAIWCYPKPVVALMHGICMGGGMGLAQGASLRIASDATRVAMPETAIGLVPDVGASWFLGRLPSALALYIGLTGSTLHAADVLYSGLADRCVRAADVSRVREVLAQIDWEGLDTDDTQAVRHALALLPEADTGTAPLAVMQPAVYRHFGQPGVQAIMASLASETDPAYVDWAQATLAVMRARSPLAMHVVYRQLQAGRRLSLADCFRMEFDLVQRSIEQGDLIEGVRALIVDKDKQPRWQPASAAELTSAKLAPFYADARGSQDACHPLSSLTATPNAA